MKVEQWEFEQSIVFSKSNIEKEADVLYLPWYMILFFMQEKEPEKLIYEIDLSNRYCSLVPRSSNDSQTHFKFLLRKRSLLTPESLSYAAKQQVFYC